jgi:hypothetical protein
MVSSFAFNFNLRPYKKGCSLAINSPMCKEAGITDDKINRKSLCGGVVYICPGFSFK